MENNEQEVPYIFYSPLTISRNNNLSANARILYSDLFTICNDNYEIKTQVNILSEISKFSTNKLNLLIKELIKNNCIVLSSEVNIVEVLKSKNLNNLGYGLLKCSWCSIKTTCLHKHHYPIFKSSGGKSIVNICPNCHSEFHNNLINIKLLITC